jgi:hypothetical protein
VADEERDDQRHKTADHRSLVVTECRRGSAHLSREALVQIRRHLPLHPAAAAHALREECRDDPQHIAGE